MVLWLPWPWLPEKFWCKPQNGQLAPKCPNFQNGRKSSWLPFSYVGAKFKCLQLVYHSKGNFIRISIVLRTRFQSWTYFELLIENQRDIFLKVFVKNRQAMKKWLNKCCGHTYIKYLAKRVEGIPFVLNL